MISKNSQQKVITNTFYEKKINLWQIYLLEDEELFPQTYLTYRPQKRPVSFFMFLYP